MRRRRQAKKVITNGAAISLASPCEWNEGTQRQSTLRSFFSVAPATISAKRKRPNAPAYADAASASLLRSTTSSALQCSATSDEHCMNSKPPGATLIPPSFSQEVPNDDSAEASNATTNTNDKKRTKPAFEQLYLDFGQSSFGRKIECTICGMLYEVGLPAEERMHDDICHNYKHGVAWPFKSAAKVKLKGVTVATTTASAYVVQVQPQRVVSNKFKDTLQLLLDIVRDDLGSCADTTYNVRQHETQFPHPTLYLYIHKQRVIGMAMMERIGAAYPVHDSMQRSRVAQKAILGVAQLWTHAAHRRRGVARCLLDAARANMVFAMPRVPKTHMAFSSPTTAGYELACAYCDASVLVYDSECA